MDLSSKRKFALSLFFFGILSVIIGATVFIFERQQSKYRMTKSIADTGTLLNSHFFGGFSIDTPSRVVDAAADGIQVDLKYGDPPVNTDPVGAALQTHNMKVIDGALNSYLSYYECHKLQTCDAAIYPELTNVSAVLNDATNHLQQMQNNRLIVGYWVLDDWPSNDYGGAKSILAQIKSLVHRYTPGRPSICGFGGGIYPAASHDSYGWNDGTAANFSPQGCDMVGFYIYGASYTTGTYDWTMSTILPAMFTSLQKRGWDINKEPLIGIPQAFGGTIGEEPWPVPTAQSIETQSKGFCQNGATGIIYYAWDNSGLDNSSQLPWNNAQITQGIRRGIAACKQYWSSNS